MNNIIKVLFLLLIAGSISFSKGFTVKSSGIKDGIIAEEHGEKGKEKVNGVPSVSIPLSWSNPPKNTKSFAVVIVDDDAIPVVGVSWYHWSVANITANKLNLERDASRKNKDLIQGVNSWVSPMGGQTKEDSTFYGGPMPPDKDHVYKIRVYALDTVLDIKNGYYLNELYDKMKGHILSVAELEGIYKK